MPYLPCRKKIVKTSIQFCPFYWADFDPSWACFFTRQLPYMHAKSGLTPHGLDGATVKDAILDLHFVHRWKIFRTTMPNKTSLQDS
jgi:hypothetical protein